MLKGSQLILAAYRVLTWVMMPSIYAYLVYRRQKGKEDPLRFNERLGWATQPRPAGKIFWIHAASVGESLSVLPLIQRLSDTYPGVTMLITTVTVNSARMMAERLPQNAIHQFVPVDQPMAVHGFLEYWQPDIAIWVESELWPCLIDRAAEHCPVILINARMSDHSYRRWNYVRAFSRAVLSRFTYVLGQTERDTDRYQQLGAKSVFYSGNIKYDAPPLPANMDTVTEISQQLGDRPVWLAASTHADEEVQIAAVHRKLIADYPTLLTIIVPRHPKRADEIMQAIGKDTVVARRSTRDKITQETGIYLADTMGELGIFYTIAPIVFIGGTLVPHGGQNPLEPARLGCAILYGPHMENFLEIRAAFQKNHASVEVQNASQLTDAVHRLLKNKPECHQLAEAAAHVVTQQSGALTVVCQYVARALEGT